MAVTLVYRHFSLSAYWITSWGRTLFRQESIYGKSLQLWIDAKLTQVVPLLRYAVVDMSALVIFSYLLLCDVEIIKKHDGREVNGCGVWIRRRHTTGWGSNDNRTWQSVPLDAHAHQHVAVEIVAAKSADDVALIRQRGGGSLDATVHGDRRFGFVHGGGVARPAVGDQIGLTIGIKGDCGDDATRGTIGSSRG